MASTLTTGSIAFTGFSADGNSSFAFVALDPITAGTEIKFTTTGWFGTGFYTTEGKIVWTADSDIDPGTVVVVENLATTAPVSNLGSIVFEAGTTMGIGASNDTLFAYTGDTASPTAFLAALANDDFSGGGATLLNTGLTLGVDAIEFKQLDNDADIGIYNGRRVSITGLEEFGAMINNPDNWITQDGGGDQSTDGIAPDLPFSTDAFVFDPDANAVYFAPGSMVMEEVEGDSGTVSFTFVVERTGISVGELAFSGTIAAAGPVDGDDFGGTIPATFSGVIADGETSATVTVNVSGDTDYEADETFTLTLTEASNLANPAYVADADNQATGVILNDDISPAEIAFTGFNADGGDNLAFVALNDIAEGTVIWFSDKLWWQGQEFYPGESTWSWTASVDVPAGSIVTMDGLAAGQMPISNFGEIAFTEGGSRDLNQDLVYAYLGEADAPSAFLALVGNAQNPGDDNLLNTGLQWGVNAVNLGTLDGIVDIAAYVGPRLGEASLEDYRALINDPANWISQVHDYDQSEDGLPPDVPFSRAGFSTAANPQAISFAAGSLNVVEAEGDTGVTLLTFTVERSGGTAGDLDFSGSLVPVGVDGDDFGGVLPTGFSGTIAAGQATVDVTIEVAGDLSFEPDESFILELLSGSNDESEVVVGTVGSAVGTVANDDIPQVVEFAAGSLQVGQVEGESGTVDITFVVERTDGTTGDVDFTGTFNAGATDAADFGGVLPTGFSGTIAAGETSAEVTVTISGDIDVEGDESFTLTLEAISNADAPVVLGDDITATGTILRDEAVPVIAFTGYNGENADDLAFVTFTDLAAGTEIQFTDKNWDGATFNSNETTWTWTATADVAAGSVITMNGLGSGQTATSNLGDVVFADGGSRGLGNSNETVFAFVGSEASPVFLSAISNEVFGNYGTLLNTGLVEGETAVSFAVVDRDLDIAAYVGSRGASDVTALLQLINDPTNWITQDASGDNDLDGIAPDLPFDTTPFAFGPNLQAVGFSAGSLTVEQSEGDSGDTVFTFTVERSGDAAGTLDFDGVVTLDGITNAADFGGVAPTSFSGAFADGESSTTVSVTVSGDVGFESDDSFTLTLTSVSATGEPAYVAATGASATGTIVNDDAVTVDIAFVGFNRNGNDDLAFVALTDIAAGTEIHFTDNLFNGSAFTSNESTWTWTAGGPIAAGSVITMSGLASGQTATSNLGTVVYDIENNRGIDNYETVYAYVGAPGAPDAFLAALSNQANDGEQVFGGTSLVAGISAMLMTYGDSIGHYDGPVSGFPTFADYKAAIYNPANWISQPYTNGTDSDGIDPDVPFDLPAFSIDPTAQLVQFDQGSLVVSEVEGDSGTTVLTFTVVRSGSTNGALDFSGAVMVGPTVQDADFAAGVMPAGFAGTIADGETSATVTIEIAGDGLHEQDETFTLELQSGTNTSANVVVGGQNTAVGVIEDDDAPSVEIAFTGLNLDTDTGMAFLALATIPAGTVIHFSDKAWGTDGFEGDGTVWTWTASEEIGAGQVVTMTMLNGDTPESNLGTVDRVGSGDVAFDADVQPVIYAYLGEADMPTAFVTAITTDSSFPTYLSDDQTVLYSVLNGTGLVDGVTAVAVDSDMPVAAFDGPRAGYPDMDALRAALFNDWERGDQDYEDYRPGDDGIWPDIPLSTLPFSFDPAAQVVGLADEPVQAKAEFDDGQFTTYTFTVERTGGTTGAIEFSGSVLTGIYAEGHPVTPDDFGGAVPTFSGVIAEGETSTTVTVLVSGDTVYEADERFTVQLDTIVNTSDVPVGAGNFRTFAFILDFDEQPAGIGAGEVITASIVVGGDDHFIIAPEAVLAVPQDDAIIWEYEGTPIVDNFGTIRSESVLNGGTEGALIFNNFEGALIYGEWDPKGRLPEGSTITVNNAGLIENAGRIFDFHDVVKGGGYAIINNLEGGVIQQLAGGNTDMIRPGARTVINNAGTIITHGFDLEDAIDYQDNDSGVVNNLEGGWIEGDRHAITGDDDITVTNAVGGTIIGRNGSAVNMDTSATETVVVVNYGRMEGRSRNLSDSDGDAIDIDGILSLENYGFVGGMGHNGYHDGEPNVSEAIAIGGGVINNYEGGHLYGFGRAIQIDDSENGSALGVATIFNAGLIEGDGNLPTGVSAEDAADYDPIGGEAINIVGEAADTLTNAVSGHIYGGVKMGGGDDMVDNAGLMVAGGGSALDLGDGDDEATNSGVVEGDVDAGAGHDTIANTGEVTGDVLLGDGDDIFEMHIGSIVGGTIDGGDGTDTMRLIGPGLGTLDGHVGFERLEVVSGTWSVASGVFEEIEVAGGASVTSTLYLADQGEALVDASASVITVGTAFMSDGTGSLDNAGFVAGLGDPSAVAADFNGGYVHNRSGGVLLGQDAVVVSGDGAGGTATNAMVIVNEGFVQGLGGDAIRLVGEQDDSLTNAGTILGNVMMGGGNDTLAIHGGSAITGTIDGGDGTDTVELVGPTPEFVGHLAAMPGFETLVVKEGIWSVEASDAYDAITIEDGAMVTSQIVVDNDDHLIIEAGGILDVDGNGIHWQGGGDVVIDNAGLIQATGRLLDTQVNLTGNLTFNNLEGGVIHGSINPRQEVRPESVIVFNNAGLIEDDGRIFDLKELVKDGASATINNLASGVIRQIGDGDSDATRLDDNTIVNNWGIIIAAEGSVDGGDLLDFDSGRGSSVYNFAGGLLEGSHHAVTGKQDLVVYNEGTMIGRNGSAVNMDTDGSVEETVFVTNHGIMEGRSAELDDSDGDAIDVDGLLVLENYGAVKGLGAEGYHDGEPNVSEAIAIGGGTINNYEGGELYGYGRAIQVDDSSNGGALGATIIVNAGLIQGDGNGPEGVEPDDAALFDLRGNEAINLVGDWTDSLTNTGTIVGGVSMGGGNDILNNTGSITALGGAAVDMGDGDDTVILGPTSMVTGTILLGAGNDVLTAGDYAVVVDAGAGDDSMLSSLEDDSFAGGDGSDTYSYFLGQGSDTINEGAGQVGDIDQLIFSDIASTDADIHRQGDDLQISLVDGSVITVTDQFADGGIELIVFSDGGVLDRAGVVAAVANRDPVAEPVALPGVDEDTPAFLVATADLLAGASDPDLDDLEVTAIGDVIGGTAVITDGGVEFTLAEDFFGAASFAYTISDGQGGSVDTVASFVVNPINDLPILQPDYASVGENETASFDLTANDNDPEDGMPSLVGFAVSSVSGYGLSTEDAATAFSIADGKLAFDPGTMFDDLEPGETATIEIAYTATDDDGGEAEGTFTLDVIGEVDANVIDGTDGFDMLVGSNGPDHTYGGSGGDFIFTLGGDDVVDGGDGNDAVFGGSGNSILSGGDGNDLILGGSGNETILGGAGNDTLMGGLGSDILNGGTGNDLLFAGTGTNRVVFGLGDGTDTMFDFARGTNNVIELDAAAFADYDALTTGGGLYDAAAGARVAYQDGSVLTLIGVKVADLSTDNFDFVS